MSCLLEVPKQLQDEEQDQAYDHDQDIRADLSTLYQSELTTAILNRPSHTIHDAVDELTLDPKVHKGREGSERSGNDRIIQFIHVSLIFQQAGDTSCIGVFGPFILGIFLPCECDQTDD